ncbi:hypothetical protein J2Z60_000612 [Lactobacillus colini]|uniref:Uncharacterized protein n=1 Tax=Lactobacillus colini TaxID=1819254 RepID=A0ABS4MCW0_9LACO|nr:hypothetical protein [Lactobacillus colini]MBP2057448.1 hypothetical protein [Lactobacillus colini]
MLQLRQYANAGVSIFDSVVAVVGATVFSRFCVSQFNDNEQGLTAGAFCTCVKPFFYC